MYAYQVLGLLFQGYASPNYFYFGLFLDRQECRKWCGLIDISKMFFGDTDSIYIYGFVVKMT